MPEERRIKMEKLRRAGDRRLSVLSCLLLFYGLRAEYGLERIPDFAYGDYGKPYFPDYPDIYFNLTHCRLGAACIVSDRETGIDMQDVRPFFRSAAERVCSAEELRGLKASARPEEDFTRLWAVKECMGKLAGTGIDSDLKNYTIENCRRTADIEVIVKPGRYALAAALKREEPV